MNNCYPIPITVFGKKIRCKKCGKVCECYDDLVLHWEGKHISLFKQIRKWIDRTSPKEYNEL